MKNLILISVLLGSLSSASAALISLNPITGVFLDGPLAGTTIFGAIEIDDNGRSSGTADNEVLTTGDGTINALSFSFDSRTFGLTDDPAPLITFLTGNIVGIDYVGSASGEILDISYDAFQPTAQTGIIVTFLDSIGQPSMGTLNLPVNVPEPSTYGLMAGALTLGLAVLRRRRV